MAVGTRDGLIDLLASHKTQEGENHEMYLI
jgi:hypothetical protein